MGMAASTVYPKKYAHGFVVLCFVVVMHSFIMNSHEVFIHIHQGCFAGTGAIVRLPQCQWSKPDGYGKISQCITTTKHSKFVHISWDILYSLNIHRLTDTGTHIKNVRRSYDSYIRILIYHKDFLWIEALGTLRSHYNTIKCLQNTIHPVCQLLMTWGRREYWGKVIIIHTNAITFWGKFTNPMETRAKLTVALWNDFFITFTNFVLDSEFIFYRMWYTTIIQNLYTLCAYCLVVRDISFKFDVLRAILAVRAIPHKHIVGCLHICTSVFSPKRNEAFTNRTSLNSRQLGN